MCGFVAIIGPGAPVPEPVLTSMRDRLAHRGPDGAANWSRRYERGSVSFGFRRLAVIDTRHVADQPMVSAGGDKVIVFNGEIYNYVELRAELERAGRVFATRSDTEVLLQAYEEWGDALLSKLNGMFAFVIWDERRGEALVARDRFGEKPLYTARLPNGALMVASEIKALLAHPEFSGALDLDMVARVVRGHLVFGVEETLFSGVTLFAAAHGMVVGVDGVAAQPRRYWAPQYDDSLGRLSRRDLRAAFRERLEAAVRKRMRTDVRMTACLSGGLDSSTLVALLARFGEPGGVRLDAAISARFPDDPTIDEGAYIDRVLAAAAVSGQAVTPTAADLVRDIRRLHWHHETIIPGASMYLEWSVMRTARDLGYKVIIDGQGADEVLAGYQIYLQAYQAELFRRRLVPQALLVGWRRDRRLRKAALGYENHERRFPARDSLTWDQLRGFHGNHVTDMVSAYSRDNLPSPEAVGALRFELALNLLRTSLPSNLFGGDRNSMAHGIECRYPFLDYELVDFCTRLPDWAYLGGAWGKNILRETTADLLPRAVRWRPEKVGFAAPQDHWLRNAGVRGWLEERVFDPSLRAVGGYDADGMTRTWQEHASGAADHSGRLWSWASAAELMDMQRTGMWRNG